MNQDKFYMQKALDEAGLAFLEDEVPVGAVIVHQGKIISKAHNQVEILRDPTAHAEILAITSACEFLRSKWLLGATLYVTIEPCSMCAGALILARIERLVFGAPDLKTGAFGSKFNINKLKLNHKLKVRSAVMKDDCAAILKEFFKKKRSNNNPGG